MSNPYLMADAPSVPWTGTGRKIHCKTVFVRRVLELVQGEGVDAVQLGDRIVCYEQVADMKVGVVFGLEGQVLYPEYPAILPKFQCLRLVITKSKMRTAEDLTRGNVHATANVILHKMGK